MKILLLGDSDISRWPTELFPECPCLYQHHHENNKNNNTNEDKSSTSFHPEKMNVQVLGYSGATLEEVVDQFQDSIIWRDSCSADEPTIIIFCAGENDIGSGIPLAKTLRIMNQFMDRLLEESPQRFHCQHFIVLGPKLEPWLNNDFEARKLYIQMSERMKQICQKRDNVIFCDCITLFCKLNESSSSSSNNNNNNHQSLKTPIADPNFFHRDQLHLNHEGYRRWKSILEDEIEKMQPSM